MLELINQTEAYTNPPNNFYIGLPPNQNSHLVNTIGKFTIKPPPKTNYSLDSRKLSKHYG